MTKEYPITANSISFSIHSDHLKVARFLTNNKIKVEDVKNFDVVLLQQPDVCITLKRCSMFSTFHIQSEKLSTAENYAFDFIDQLLEVRTDVYGELRDIEIIVETNFDCTDKEYFELPIFKVHEPRRIGEQAIAHEKGRMINEINLEKYRIAIGFLRNTLKYQTQQSTQSFILKVESIDRGILRAIVDWSKNSMSKYQLMFVNYRIIKQSIYKKCYAVTKAKIPTGKLQNAQLKALDDVFNMNFEKILQKEKEETENFNRLNSQRRR